jgi:hypothetical protein
MMRKKISQTDAQWYKKRAEEAEATLRNQRNRWAAEIATARLLGHAVVVVADSNNQVRFYPERL